MEEFSNKLILVRHSLPQIEPNVPPAEWVLNDEGRRRAKSVAERLRAYSTDAIWSSREPKALETADIIGDVVGVPVGVKDGLEEHHRENVPFFEEDEEFRRTVQRIFAEPDQTVMGTESGNEALDRFGAAIDAILGASDCDNVIVTHGT